MKQVFTWFNITMIIMILAVLGIIAFVLVSQASASPFLISDPNSTAVGGRSEISEGGIVIMDSALKADGSVYQDLVGVSNGNHTYSVRVYINDAVWGRLESTAVPFSFAKPASPNPTSGLKLLK